MRAKRFYIPWYCEPPVFIALIVLFPLCCTISRNAPIVKTVVIASRSSWNAREAKPYKQHVPLRMTVHHEGTPLKLSDDAAKKINAIQRWGMGPDKQWADIPYHFLIAPGGTIYQGRDPYTVGETSTEYDPTGHLLICCLGNRATDSVPTPQLEALVQLISYASIQFDISLDSLGTHKNFSKQTTCPGKFLSVYFDNGYIRNRLRNK